MNPHRYYAGVLAWLVAAAAGAQEPAWTVYKPTNTGLPGNYVYSVAVAADGRVWATADDPIWDEGGLTAFDGDVWQDWTNVDGRAPTHQMDRLQMDANGKWWVATDYGLMRLDDGEVVTVWSTANTPWPTNKVADFDWDSEGNLWVALDDVQTVRGGLARYDGTAWTVFTTANGLPWEAPWDNVTAVEIDGQDRVWFGSDVLGGGMFNGSSWTWLGVSGTWVTDIAIASGGDPWFIFANYGIRSWSSGQWVDRTAHFNPYDVARVVLDRAGFIWVTTYVGSIWRFNGTGWDVAYSVPGLTHVYGLAFDESNRPWVGGIGGLLHRGANGVWTRYTTMNTGLPSRWIDHVTVAADGRAWFSTAGGGLSAFDGARWVNFNPYNFGTPAWPFPTDGVEETVQDMGGGIWVAATNAGVGRWDGSQWATHLPSVDVHGLAVHPSGDILAVPDIGQARRWDGTTWTIMNHPPFTQGNAIAADALGHVWIATINGLMRFDGSQWTHYTSSNSGLPSNYVRDLQAASGAMWVATDQGLARFDGSFWTVFTRANSGIPADNVATLALAPDGALWVGAFNGQTWPYYGGVSRFDGTTWTTYTRQNSPLPHEQVEGLAVDADGGVWVTTASEGVAYIHPGGTTSDEPGTDDPRELAIEYVYPNPAVDRLHASVTLPEAARVSITLYDLTGRRVSVLHDGMLAAGSRAVTWDVASLPAGIYMLRATAGSHSASRLVTIRR